MCPMRTKPARGESRRKYVREISAFRPFTAERSSVYDRQLDGPVSAAVPTYIAYIS